LDLDWDDPEAKAQALSSILQALERVEALLPKLTHLNAATAEPAL
jgi:hypothetical protein